LLLAELTLFAGNAIALMRAVSANANMAVTRLDSVNALGPVYSSPVIAGWIDSVAAFGSGAA
jgi:hypothetical protein